MKVTQKTYGGGKDGAEVVLVVIEGGGHTWPGQEPPVKRSGQVDQERLGQRPDVGVLREAPDEVTRNKARMMETNVTRAVIRKPGEGRTIAVVGDVYRFLATGEDTNGKYALWEAIVPPGGGPPPHVHSREEEGFYILEGEITFQIGDERLVATAGMFANMPVGTPHSFKNESSQTGEDADFRRACRAGEDVLRVRRAAA